MVGLLVNQTRTSEETSWLHTEKIQTAPQLNTIQRKRLMHAKMTPEIPHIFNASIETSQPHSAINLPAMNEPGQGHLSCSVDIAGCHLS